MNKIQEAYVGMHSKPEVKTPQMIISEAQKEISKESDNDYSSEPVVKDLIENYSKADLINMVTVLAKKLST